jgi:hypothetical protein
MSKFPTKAVPSVFALTVSLALAGALVSHYQTTRNAASQRVGSDSEVLRRNVALSPLDPAVHLALAMRGATSNTPPQEIEQRALRSAAQLAPYDANVIRAEAFRLFEAGDQKRALEKIRTLSIIDAESHNDVLNALLQVAGGTAWIEHVNTLTQERSAMLDAIAHSTCSSKRELALAIWVATRAASVNRLLPRTLDCLVSRVASAEDALDVYTLWIDSLRNKPTAIPFVFNGDFEMADPAGPFAWRIGTGGEYRDGYTARIVTERAASGTNRLLQFEFNARPIRSELLAMNMALPPGSYRLNYRAKDDVVTDGSRPEFAVYCHRSNVRLGEALAKPSALGQNDDGGRWKTISRSFEVDGTCHLQRLVLTSTAPNWQARGYKGRISLDDVTVSRQ